LPFWPFDFVAPRLPANVRYVGPQLDDPDWAAADWHSQGRDPLVLVATSSIFQHQVGLLQRIARALGQLPVQGLMTTGPAVDPDEIGAPPNVDIVQARRTAGYSPRHLSSSLTPATAR
jgi:UDP:flavonoid glycosyltransferase YjiC (YdhE family)